MAIPFVNEFDFEYGRCDRLSPLIRRVICNNPGPFTYTGTGTYIIGNGDVAAIDPGPLDDTHLDAILAALEPDEKVSHIVITHTHLDHSPLAMPLKARTGAEIMPMRRGKWKLLTGPNWKKMQMKTLSPTIL